MKSKLFVSSGFRAESGDGDVGGAPGPGRRPPRCAARHHRPDAAAAVRGDWAGKKTSSAFLTNGPHHNHTFLERDFLLCTLYYLQVEVS